MSEVLYRKYRSKTFSELIGQDHIKNLLVSSIKSDKIQHAYLFSGPRGTGKTSTARLFAKAINSDSFKERGDIDPEDETILLIEKGQVLDIVELDAASNRGIEEIRQLKESINYLPTRLKYKVYIIDEAHMLTKEAFNALLKTLEEPPAHVVIILATTEPHKIPITILSRVQRYDFNLVNRESLLKKLEFILKSEEIKYEESALELIYDASGGSFRDAESILNKIINERGEEITYEIVKSILGLIDSKVLAEITDSIVSGNINETLNIFTRIRNEVADLGAFLDQYIRALKDMMVQGITSGDNIINYQKIIAELLKAKSDLRSFDDASTLVQISFIKLCNEFSGNKLSSPNNLREKSSIANNSKETENSISEPEIKIMDNENSKSNPIKNDDEVNQPISKGNVNEVEIKKNSDTTNDSIDMKKLGDFAGEISNRLKAIIISSDISLNESYLIIKNRYNFNIKFLNDPETKKNIINIIQKMGLGSKEIKIELGEVSEKESNTQSKVDSKIDLTEESATVTKKDNSDLVESILL
ncbi:MAG: DNA polymerase III subunit gamma/tau [Candidatus Dojkabacteria bacterium]|nr:DNA polymerase III subunit gamma/tau [Candidatus Dojkabacteria bacterium]MDQ7021702.1 DNA polymerase III subunit gamma/tau [Candidatus Dojkabacteria bacterium]